MYLPPPLTTTSMAAIRTALPTHLMMMKIISQKMMQIPFEMALVDELLEDIIGHHRSFRTFEMYLEVYIT